MTLQVFRPDQPGFDPPRDVGGWLTLAWNLRGNNDPRVRARVAVALLMLRRAGIDVRFRRTPGKDGAR